jgi:hypothetical protein
MKELNNNYYSVISVNLLKKTLSLIWFSNNLKYRLKDFKVNYKLIFEIIFLKNLIFLNVPNDKNYKEFVSKLYFFNLQEI